MKIDKLKVSCFIMYDQKNSFLFHLLLLLLIVTFCGCPDKAVNPVDKVYHYSDSLVIDGYIRTWQIDLPLNYYEEKSLSLVIFLHGTGGSADQCKKDYKFSDKAENQNFMVIYPEGIRSDGVLGIRTWNAGMCCDYASEQQVDDVHFIENLINLAISKYKVDPKKIYVTGISNGAMMAYRLAVEIPEKIAAIAPVSGTMMIGKSCDPKKTIPILHIHSVLDMKVPPAGGVGIGGYYFPPVDSVLNVWSLINKCSTITTSEFDCYTVKKWNECENNATILFYLTKDGGHAWPGGLKSRVGADSPSVAVDANELILDFFNKH